MIKDSDIKKVSFIRDAVHKNIDISEPVIQELIACQEFQRLRRISQLSGAQIAFPSATHTRFTHSLGVYHILNRIFNQVSGAQELDAQEKLVVKIAGLLHDIGHGPFSHTFEKITNYRDQADFIFSHEWYTCAIISDETTQINQVLKKYKINVNQVVAIIKKDLNHCKKYQVQLVSSQLDCDRIDYLMRDGYFTGVNYGSIDLDWVISNMVIDQEKGIVFLHKAIYAIENYLIARFHMYSQVYYHKSSIFFDVNLQELFMYIEQLIKTNYCWKVDLTLLKNIWDIKPFTVSEYLKLNDFVIFDLLNKIIISEQDEKLVALANNVLYSKDHWKLKTVLDLKELDQKKHKVKILKNIIYNLQKEPIIIKTDDNRFLPLEKVSQVLKNPTNEQLIIYSWEN